MSPIFAYLVAESLYCSGYNTLILVGLFQSIYTLNNLETWKQKVVMKISIYVSHSNRQIGCILMGIITPMYIQMVEVKQLGIVLLVLFFQICQVFLTHFVQNKILPRLLQYGSNSKVLSRSEKRSLIMQQVGSYGVLTFTLAYSTKNLFIITTCLVYVNLSIIVNLTFGIYLI